VIWTPEQIEGGKRDYIRYFERPGLSDANKYIDLYNLMHDFIGSEDPEMQLQMQDGSMMNYYPVKKVSVPVDTNLVRKNGTVEPNDIVTNEIRFDIPKDILMKNDLAVLNIIAANKWQRPIYFTSAFGELGFGEYLRAEGQCHRLIPVIDPDKINSRASYEIIKNKYAFGNANIKGVYFDEENRRHLLGIRQSIAEAAVALSNEGQNEKAKELLNILDKNMLSENIPYGLMSRYNQHDYISFLLLEIAYKCGNKEVATKIKTSLAKDLQQQLAYFANIGNMSVNELMQATQELIVNKGDNLTNSQKNMFTEIRQAIALNEAMRNLEIVYK
jgi:hypothetical protein